MLFPEKNGLNTLLTSEGEITVIEADMKEVMDQFQNDSSVAFAHCISRDFNHYRQMSAGVAVVFRNQFGKPKFSDAKCEYLACQKVKNGATVYGLVTKARYFEKPLRQDYDKAFKYMTDDFMKKNLNKLICPPMGCGRDRIPLEHFARNILKFQSDTKGSVSIITLDESGTRVLKNGLTNKDFVVKLQNIFTESKRNAEKAKMFSGKPKLEEEDENCITQSNLI